MEKYRRDIQKGSGVSFTSLKGRQQSTMHDQGIVIFFGKIVAHEPALPANESIESRRVQTVGAMGRITMYILCRPNFLLLNPNFVSTPDFPQRSKERVAEREMVEPP